MKHIVSLLLVSLNLAAQSPWTKKKKEAYLQLSFTTISNYSEIFGDPDYITDREINDNTIQFYTEYGLTDKTTLLVNLPFKLVSSNDLVVPDASAQTTEASENSLGNIQLGVKHNFINKKWLLTGQLNVEFNTSSFDELSGLRTGYDATTITPLILTGRGFDTWYIQAFTGVDIRSNDYSSSFKLGGEIGYKASDNIWLAGFLDGVASLTDGDVAVSNANRLTGLYINNQSYAGFGLKVIGEINKKLGANIALGGAFGARNVSKAPAITIGAYYKI